MCLVTDASPNTCAGRPRWSISCFAADPSPPEIPADFGKAAGGATGASCAQFPKSPNLDATGRPLTLEAWMTATNPNGVIMAKGGPAEGFALTLEGGLPNFHIRSANQLSTVAGKKRIVGGWHHVVGVLKDTLEMELYVDGEQVGTGKASGFLTKDPAQGLEIAADLGSGVGEYQSPFGFTGVIDEVRIYFEAATAAAIKQRYENEVEMGADPKLVVTFDDGSARDMSLYRNNGTVEGGIPIEGHSSKGVRFSNNLARLNVNDDDNPAKPNANKAGGKGKQNGNAKKAGNQEAGNQQAGNQQAGKAGNNANNAIQSQRQ